MLEIYVSATRPDYTPDMGANLAAVMSAVQLFDNRGHESEGYMFGLISDVSPMLGVWKGGQEHSVRIQFDNATNPAEVVTLARHLANVLSQEAVMVGTDTPYGDSWTVANRWQADAGYVERSGIENYSRAIGGNRATVYEPSENGKHAFRLVS